jgi:PPOX class probable F420-dependent enzyme
VNREEAMARLDAARVGHIATADAGGVPHVVPIVFARDGDVLYSAVDRKPKRSKDLKRLANIAANPNVELVADHYEEDWPALWWVRVGGPARILDAGPELDHAIATLAKKYQQYREEPPDGRAVAVRIARWSAWDASEQQATAQL